MHVNMFVFCVTITKLCTRSFVRVTDLSTDYL